MMGLVISLLLLLGAAAFAWFRIQWVFKQQTKHNEAVFDFVMRKAGAKEYISSVPYYDCLVSYDTMFYKFWLWSLSDFVVDQEKFDEVHGK